MNLSQWFESHEEVHLEYLGEDVGLEPSMFFDGLGTQWILAVKISLGKDWVTNDNCMVKKCCVVEIFTSKKITSIEQCPCRV